MTIDPDRIPRPLLAALVASAQEVTGAPRTGRKRIEAEATMGRILVAINGAPLMFRGLLSPDNPPYPLPGVDPYVLEALAEFGVAPADPLDRPAQEAAFRCTDELRNVAYIRHTASRGWSCTLANGTPASMFYAGITDDETEAKIALERAKTARDALNVIKARISRRTTVEVV